MAVDARVARNYSALSDPKRYRTLSTLLGAAISSRAELSDGYAYAVDGGKMSLPKLGEWINLERECCPFLSFEISIPGAGAQWWLTVTGPEGTKVVLEQMFPA